MPFLKNNLFALFLIGLLYSNGIAQTMQHIPIQTISDSVEFLKITQDIRHTKKSLYVFDVDNTLIITNKNKFGSDWWYSQTKSNPDLKLNVDAACLFGVLTPLFYATLSTTALFSKQAAEVAALGKKKSRTIALTSRGYTKSVAKSTEVELKNNDFTFLEKDSAVLAKDVVMLNGVIYTKGQNKGSILLNYLNNKDYKKVYYFDDSIGKVKDVQKAFSSTPIDINIYHMKIAAKVPYTSTETKYMQDKLCNLIQTINEEGTSSCSCEK